MILRAAVFSPKVRRYLLGRRVCWFEEAFKIDCQKDDVGLSVHDAVIDSGADFHGLSDYSQSGHNTDELFRWSGQDGICRL